MSNVEPYAVTPGRWYRQGYRPRSLGVRVARIVNTQCDNCGKTTDDIQKRRVGTPRRQKTLNLCAECRAPIDALLEVEPATGPEARYKISSIEEINRLKRQRKRKG